MAIIVEEEQPVSGKSSPLMSLVIWLTILAIIAAAVYYVFFAQPDFIPTTVDPRFRSTEELARLSVDPQTVVEHPVFRSLLNYVTIPETGRFGRPNPFLAQ